MAKQLKITWVRSAIRRKKNQKVTLGHLGLRRLNHSVVQPDNPQIRGMGHNMGGHQKKGKRK